MATIENELQSQVRIKVGPQPEVVGSKLNHQFQAGAAIPVDNWKAEPHELAARVGVPTKKSVGSESPQITEGRTVRGRIQVFVSADDPVYRAGLASQLRQRAELAVVDELEDAEVAVVATDEVDERAAQAIRAIQRKGCARVVAVVARLDDAGLLVAAEAGACGLLRRSQAQPEALLDAVTAAAAGDGTVPRDLLGRLMDQIGRLQREVLAPHGMTLAGLGHREVDVLRLVADGLSTSEIAGHLSYSERTVKNIIHDVTTRLQLRNRSHAVAYVLREGLI